MWQVKRLLLALWFVCVGLEIEGKHYGVSWSVAWQFASLCALAAPEDFVL